LPGAERVVVDAHTRATKVLCPNLAAFILEHLQVLSRTFCKRLRKNNGALVRSANARLAERQAIFETDPTHGLKSDTAAHGCATFLPMLRQLIFKLRHEPAEYHGCVGDTEALRALHGLAGSTCHAWFLSKSKLNTISKGLFFVKF
jgi:hypothetical protein